MPDENEIFHEICLRLFSGRPIHRAWQDCLVYLTRFIPADYFSLLLFDAGFSVVETVIDATVEKSEPVSHKTTLTPQARRAISRAIDLNHSERNCTIIPDLSRDEMSRQLGLDLGTPQGSCLAIDLVADGRFLGLATLTDSQGRPFTEEQARLLSLLHPALFASADQFHRLRELERVQNLLTERADFLRQELLNVVEDEIIGAKFGLKSVMDLVERVALTDAPVLILGETGVGKEVIAGAIHRSSPRRSGPFIKVNCGSIPQSLLESELFGHEKGAFTGAFRSKPGYFERADGGTIFLDEIGELSPQAQVRLLRVLQENEVQRVGGKTSLKLDLRVVAATHRDLPAMIKGGSFRDDLYFRLNVFPILIPPLRDRPEDIPALAYHLTAKKAKQMALVRPPTVAPGAVDALMDYHWPGNVRELENVIERQIILSQGRPISFDRALFPDRPADQAPNEPNLEEQNPEERSIAPGSDELNLEAVVKAHLARVLRLTKGKVEGPGGAAELLGLNPRTLQSRMKKLSVPFGRAAKGMYD